MIKSTYEWTCDLCERHLKTESAALPKEWVELVFNVDADAKQLPVRHVCFMCAARIAEIRACQIAKTSMKLGVHGDFVPKQRTRAYKHKAACLNDNANECPMPGPGH
jgi:hypothetical protein